MEVAFVPNDVFDFGAFVSDEFDVVDSVDVSVASVGVKVVKVIEVAFVAVDNEDDAVITTFASDSGTVL